MSAADKKRLEQSHRQKTPTTESQRAAYFSMSGRQYPRKGDRRIPAPGITGGEDSRYRGDDEVFLSFSGRRRRNCAGAAEIGLRVDCIPRDRAPSISTILAKRLHRRFCRFRARACAWVWHTDRCIRARRRGHRYRVHDRQRQRAHDDCACMRLRGARPARAGRVLHRRQCVRPPRHPAGTARTRSSERRLARSGFPARRPLNPELLDSSRAERRRRTRDARTRLLFRGCAPLRTQAHRDSPTVNPATV